jgi:hypothetical protein
VLQEYSGRFGIDKTEQATTEGKSLVYGWIEFDVASTKYFADLSCVILALDGIQSEKIYIDNVAHVIPTRIEISEEASRFQVYWLFGVSDFRNLVKNKSARLESADGCSIRASE